MSNMGTILKGHMVQEALQVCKIGELMIEKIWER